MKHIRHYKYRAKETVEKTLQGITCNMCGEEYEKTDDPQINMELENDFFELNFKFGHGSVAYGEEWGVDLCEICTFDMIADLKHPPTGFLENLTRRVMGESVNWIEDGDEFQRKLFEKWKKKYVNNGSLLLSKQEIYELAIAHGYQALELSEQTIYSTVTDNKITVPGALAWSYNNMSKKT